MTIVFENRDLLPLSWRDTAAGRAARVFNAGLVGDGEEWLLAYRVAIEPANDRRIALCRLDAGFRIIPDSVVPFSDHIRFPQPEEYPVQARVWFAA